MKLVRFYIFLLIIASCKPEELPTMNTENPVFSVSGGSIDIIAGEEDFYLFTDYEKDDENVYSFIARFAKLSDCETECKEELLIEIRDAQQTLGSNGVDIDNALKVGNYPFRVANPVITNDSVTLSMTAHPDSPNAFSYLWSGEYLGNTFSFTTFNPSFEYGFEYSPNVPPVNICLTVLSNNNCLLQFCDEIDLNTINSTCQANFTLDNSSPLVTKLVAEMINGTGPEPYTYEWSTDTTGQEITFPNMGPFNDTICITITDAAGCQDEICKEVYLNQQGTPNLICGSPFSYEKIFEAGIGDSLELGAVLIQYTDIDGTVYRSDYQEQSNGSFVIESVEDYEKNENGDMTKKLKISANCVLYDGSGVPKVFPFEGVIAVAYP